MDRDIPASPGARAIRWLALLPIALSVTFSPLAPAEPGGWGPIMIVGGVLSLKDRRVWQRIAELVGGEVVVIAAANSRPALYGSYAVRGLERAGLTANLLPIAPAAADFGRDHRDASRDPEIVARVLEASAVFFVGGEPQRLAEVLFEADGGPTPLAAAIRELQAEGGLVIGGIPASRGANTGLESGQVLERGHLLDGQVYRGLGLVARDWHLDQHFFVGDRFAETLVGMVQFEQNFGLGVAPNTAALLDGDSLEVIGDGGVMLIDLSRLRSDGDVERFNVTGIRLSLLGNGDRVDLATARVTPSRDKLDGFEIRPLAEDHAPMLAKRPDEGRNRLVEHLLAALDGSSKQASGYLLHREDGRVSGFEYRCSADGDTRGWLATTSADARYTALDIRLDLIPLNRSLAEKLAREASNDAE